MSWNIFKLHAERVNRRMQRRLDQLQERYDNELDNIRCRADMDFALVDRYFEERDNADYQAVFELDEPLVTVCIATFNRAELLAERAISSILKQSYKRFELIVVGDCCTDNTPEVVARFNDPRLRFINLDRRGDYPKAPDLRWMVAGSVPMNHALSLAQGQFITHLDDDDEHAPDRLEKLLHCAKTQRAEMVWHPFHYEIEADQWVLHEAPTFGYRQVTTSSVLYHHWLKRIPWDVQAWRFREPGDWNRFRKFKYLGIKAVRHPEPLLKHYRERANKLSG